MIAEALMMAARALARLALTGHFRVVSPARRGVAWGGEGAMRAAFGKVRRQLRK